jgi:hypothetical protein
MKGKNSVIKSSISTLSLASILFLTGCGGGSGGSVAAGVSGIVSGSFYAGAIVCYDTDGDGTCTGEGTVASDSDGSFTLNGSADYIIIAELNGATKHEVVGDAGTVVAGTTKFRIPPGAADANGVYIVSAISTKVWDEMEQNSTMTLAQAKIEVASALGVDSTQLLENFNSSSMDSEIRNKLLDESENILALMVANNGDINASALRTYVSSLMLPSQIDVIDAE